MKLSSWMLPVATQIWVEMTGAEESGSRMMRSPLSRVWRVAEVLGNFIKLIFLLSGIDPGEAGDVGLECLLGGDVCGDFWDGGKFLGLVVFVSDGVVEG